MPLAPYDPCRPLTPGAWLIEASAGTGKTHAITDLVLRLVAEEGLRIEEILVVTFTQAATAELRQRVRARLAGAARALEARQAGAPPAPGDDRVLARLLDSPEPHALRVRLRAALEDFDAAAISTIHGFCQRMLQLHAFESQTGFDQELLEDPGALLSELVDDFLAQAFARADARTSTCLQAACGLRREALLGLARAVLAQPTAVLAPAEGAPGAGAGDARARWDAALAHFRAAWQDGGREDLLRAIQADREAKGGLLDGRVYRRGQSAKYAARLDAWLAEAGLPETPDWGRGSRDAWIRHFTARQAAPFVHPALDAWQALTDAAAPLVQAPWLAFARAVREELPRRLAARGLMTFDDLLTRIRDRLRQPGLVSALRRRFRAALVDEFQDTDTVQWDIFRRLFADSPEHRLVLIGDPKQAIYAFRGADVFVYRAAGEHTRADARFTMPVNHRADAGYLDALGRLFGPAEAFAPRGPFDLEFIGYPGVAASPRLAEPGLRFPRGRPGALPAALSLRWFDGRSLPGHTRGPLSKGALQALVPGWLAADVAELLAAGGEVRAGDGFRPLGPQDLAVLVRKNSQAREIQAALRARGLPAVLAQAGNVLESEEAQALERWLEAALAPGRDGPARVLAASQLFGWTGPELAAPEPGRWSTWLEAIAGWARLLEQDGLARAARVALEEPWQPGAPSALERLLGLPDGERRATDLRHVLELLQTAATREHLGPTGLLGWLRERRERRDLEQAASELRLESEAQAVQIVTLHKAKGLQYPLVFLPYAWDGKLGPGDAEAPLLVHEPADSTGLLLDLHRDPSQPDRAARAARADEEALQESLRLLYVGLTRARHAAVVTWGLALRDSPTAALGVLLHGRAGPDRASAPAPERAVLRAAARVRAALEDGGDGRGLCPDLEALRSGNLAWTPIRPAAGSAAGRAPAARPAPGAPPAGLQARRLARGFDRTFRRSSYTSLAEAAEAGRPAAPPPPPAAAAPSPDADLDFHPVGPAEPAAPGLPGGRAAGRWVHKVLEELDFRDLRERRDRPGSRARTLEELCAAQGRRLGFASAEAHQALASILTRALRTPLGEELGGLRLEALALGDRLDELRFELPLAGGLAWRPGAPPVAGAALSALLARPGGPWPDDYPARVADLRLPDLAGFLTGAVDLIFRAPGPDGPRWYLADYKTNRVGPERAALLQEMARHHYPLQYHLYLVALHRYLRWRLGAAYDYERCVGGCLYLFLRVMDGRPGAGVLFDRPPRAVIEGLSRVLGEAGGGSA
ncbi:MAG TPA: UvrD-helicase domain-containing protein [Myxococcota bacterium]|nr:UvrD-helicase domain-containing protein [Myxococcota bacterium]HRY96722.1 UvrD-helicase domain-containing protein [Myxococcota bacterium]